MFFSKTFTFLFRNSLSTSKTLNCPRIVLHVNKQFFDSKFYSQYKLFNNVRHNVSDEDKKKAFSLFNYLLAATIGLLGMGFVSAPLFSAYCNATGYAGTINISREKTKNLQKVENRELTIQFNADKSSFLQWNFRPLQSEIKCAPGETVLAFYTAQNPTDKTISGISTYNVVPFEAGKYFNKIQCFCFDEQQLNPHEQVDMPVFFYIDPEYAYDPYLYGQNHITLSYTFFEAIEGLELPFMSKFKE